MSVNSEKYDCQDHCIVSEKFYLFFFWLIWTDEQFKSVISSVGNVKKKRTKSDILWFKKNSFGQRLAWVFLAFSSCEGCVSVILLKFVGFLQRTSLTITASLRYTSRGGDAPGGDDDDKPSSRGLFTIDSILNRPSVHASADQPTRHSAFHFGHLAAAAAAAATVFPPSPDFLGEFLNIRLCSIYTYVVVHNIICSTIVRSILRIGSILMHTCMHYI